MKQKYLIQSNKEEIYIYLDRERETTHTQKILFVCCFRILFFKLKKIDPADEFFT